MSGAGSPTARLGPIELAPGVRPRHLLSFLWASVVLIGLFTYLTLLTPFVLNVNLALPEERQGQVSGLLQFWQEIIILLCIGWWGAMSDRVGRRLIFIAGFAIMGLAFALYPFAGSVPELVGYRLVYGFGLAAASAMLSTVLADYPAERSRGTLIGISFLLNGLGSVFFFVVLAQLPTIYAGQGASELWSGRLAYLTVAAIALFSAGVMFGLKPGRPTQAREKAPIAVLLADGIRAARNPRIALAYGSAFAARADMAMVTLFLSLWVSQSGTASGLTPAQAAAAGGIAIGISQATATFFAPVLGIIGDRLNRVTVMAIAFGIAACGYSWIAFTDDFLNVASATPALVLLGMGLSGAILASTLLLGQEAPAHLRGSIFGLQAFVGAIGILVISVGGGWLFDNVGPWAPFAAMGTANSIIFVWSLLVRRYAPSSAALPRAAVIAH
jgi:MFS family permease